MSKTTPFGINCIPLFKKIIEEWTKEDGINSSSLILKTAMETLLEIERNTFLGYDYKEKPKDKNKRNGYYTRLIKSLSGSFEIKIPRDRFRV